MRRSLNAAVGMACRKEYDLARSRRSGDSFHDTTPRLCQLLRRQSPSYKVDGSGRLWPKTTPLYEIKRGATVPGVLETNSAGPAGLDRLLQVNLNVNVNVIFRVRNSNIVEKHLKLHLSPIVLEKSRRQSNNLEKFAESSRRRELRRIAIV